jgi:serine/threonine kinase PknH
VVWLDHELTGGDAWWAAILEQIRASNVFVMALSQHALQSKPYQAEWAYAGKLSLPILPVQIGEVESFRVPSIFKIQSIDYRKPTSRTGIALMAALQECAGQYSEPSDPLPDEPPIPYE